MLQQQFIINVEGNSPEEVKAALVAAGTALSTSAEPEFEAGVNFDISLAPAKEPSGWQPNTLYVVGTNAEGAVVISGTRSTSNAARDEHIMSSALELSQAAELRGVQFTELRLGGLFIRPASKLEPLRDVVQEYALSHITDLAQLEDADIPHFVRTLPGLIAMMKIAAADGTPDGVNLAKLMPVIRYIPNDDPTVEVRSETASVKASGDQLQAGWNRTKQATECSKSATGQHHGVRDDDAPLHGCCQACGKVMYLG